MTQFVNYSVSGTEVVREVIDKDRDRYFCQPIEDCNTVEAAAISCAIYNSRVKSHHRLRG